MFLYWLFQIITESLSFMLFSVVVVVVVVVVFVVIIIIVIVVVVVVYSMLQLSLVGKNRRLDT